MHNYIKNEKMIILWLAIIIISLAEFRTIYRLEGGPESLENFGINERQLLQGEHHIKAWTNRWLAPHLILGFHNTTHIPWHSTSLFLSVILLLASNLIFFNLSARFTPNVDIAFRYTIYYILSIILLQHYYMFLWDFIDILIFTLFAYGILARRSVWYFVVLFTVQIFNRESALFIAFYLFIDSIQWHPKITVISKRKMAVSLLLASLGMIYIKYMRNTFYHGPPREYAYQGLPGLIGSENHLWYNVKSFAGNFYYLFKFNPNFNVIVSLYIIFLFYLVYRFMRCNRPELQRASVILCVVIFSIFISGLIMETRMWLITLPFIGLLHIFYTYGNRDIFKNVPALKTTQVPKPRLFNHELWYN